MGFLDEHRADGTAKRLNCVSEDQIIDFRVSTFKWEATRDFI